MSIKYIGVTHFIRIFVFIFDRIDTMLFVKWNHTYWEESDYDLKFIWKIKPTTTPLSECLKNIGL